MGWDTEVQNSALNSHPNITISVQFTTFAGPREASAWACYLQNEQVQKLPITTTTKFKYDFWLWVTTTIQREPEAPSLYDLIAIIDKAYHRAENWMYSFGGRLAPNTWEYPAMRMHFQHGPNTVTCCLLKIHHQATLSVKADTENLSAWLFYIQQVNLVYEIQHFNIYLLLMTRGYNYLLLQQWILIIIIWKHQKSLGLGTLCAWCYACKERNFLDCF